MTETSTTQLVGVAIPTLRELRAAVLTSSSPEAAVEALRQAGFAGGEAVHNAFEQWLSGSRLSEAATGRTDSTGLTVEAFGHGAAMFFRNAGWGDVTFLGDETEGVAMLDIADCWEAAGDGSSAGPGCHITTGLLAAFFGLIAGYPVAVMETECADGSGSRCRFVMGNAEVMNYKWQEMQ